MSTRKATAAELFHNLTLAFRQVPQFEYEYAYPAKTLALIETPFWRLTPDQLAQRLEMIDRGMAESTVENRRVRLMAMRPEHRYLLIPAYVRLAAVTAYADLSASLPEVPAIADLGPVIWTALHALDSARDMNTPEWAQIDEKVRSVYIAQMEANFESATLSPYTNPAKAAVWLAMFMTFSTTPDVFYKQLVA